MTIEKSTDNTKTILKLSGCLDTAAASEFSTALENVSSAKELILDFSDLDFIASSGLRALVLANKKATAAGNTIILTGLNEVVADVFDVTGLTEVFTIR